MELNHERANVFYLSDRKPHRFKLLSTELAGTLNLDHDIVLKRIKSCIKENSDFFNESHFEITSDYKAKPAFAMTRNGLLCALYGLREDSQSALRFFQKLVEVHRTYEERFGVGTFYPMHLASRHCSYPELIIEQFCVIETTTDFKWSLDSFLSE